MKKGSGGRAGWGVKSLLKMRPENDFGKELENFDFARVDSPWMTL